MPEDRGKASGKPGPRYVWDAEKSAWVDTGGTSPEEASAQIAESAGAEVSGKPKAGYVWDEETSSWIAADKISPAEASGRIAEPARAEVMEPQEAEGTLAAETLEETESVEMATEVERLEYKGVLMRVGGALIDLIILTIVNAILSYTVGQFIVSIPTYFLPIYGLLYFVGFWSWRGQTPGKMLIRAKVVRRDGTDIGFGRALLRWLFYLMPASAPITFLAGILGAWTMVILPLISIAVMVFSRDKQGIHDLIAGTVVVDARSPIFLPRTVVSDQDEGPEAGESDTTE